MSITLHVSASMALLSALASPALAQFDPVFPGLPIPVAPTGTELTFQAVVAADVDLDGLGDLLSLTDSATPAVDYMLGVSRGLPGGGYAPPELWPLDFTIGNLSMAVGDLTGDGWPDVAVNGPHHVLVLRGMGGGQFNHGATYFVTGDSLSDIALEDVDRDGRPDLVTASRDSDLGLGHINVNLADGTGGYFATQAWPAGVEIDDLACGDLDGDGWLDVAAVGPASVLQILPSDGAGGFLAPQSLPAKSVPRRVLLGSLDADADLDVVVIAEGKSHYSNSSHVSAWLNDGAGHLQAGVPVAYGRTDMDGLLHDADADGDLDVMVVDAGQYEQYEQVVLIENDGAGCLSLGDALGVNAPIEHATLSDGNGDGVPDLLLTPIGTSAVLLPARPDGSLAIGPACALPEHPQHCVAGDLDGDGWQDVVYTAFLPTMLATLLGSPDGLLPTPIPSPSLITTGLYDVTLGDLTGDGRLDALVVQLIDPAETVAVGPGLGDGTFGIPLTAHYPTGGVTPLRIEAVDMDADGWLDAALLGRGTLSRLDLYYNDGAAQPGQLGDVHSVPLGAQAADFVAVELDGDGALDAIVARSPASTGLSSTLAVLLGDGGGGLSAPVSSDLPQAPTVAEYLAVADFDLDGALDAAVSFADGALALVPGDGAGGWVPGTLLPAPAGYLGSTLAAADVDGDGWPDVVQAASSSSGVLLRCGDGAGGLLAPQAYCAPGLTRDALLADMTRDGRPDLLSADWVEQLDLHGYVRVSENVRRTFTWTDLGHAKAGPHGEPRLNGTGTLAPGSSGALHLGQAAPSALAALLFSDAEQPTAWKGGVLVPAAPQLVLYEVTDPQGRVLLAWSTWPGDLAGVTMVLQFAIEDVGAPEQTVLSNALRAALPD